MRNSADPDQYDDHSILSYNTLRPLSDVLRLSLFNAGDVRLEALVVSISLSLKVKLVYVKKGDKKVSYIVE